jgi:hypothetical protein
MSYTSYVYYFQEFAPEIEIRRPKKDVCNTYIRFRNSTFHGDNEKWLQHLHEASKRRFIYGDDNKLAIQARKENIQFQMISFNFKQNINIPYQSWQANMLFYKRKIAINIFNVVNEGDGIHNIYCYEERVGNKSADEICTILWDYFVFQKLSLLKSGNHLVVYADNCAGQNKNRYIIAFFHYIVVVLGWFPSIRIKYMVSGHTHFSPDRCFSWLNKLMNTWPEIYTPAEVLKMCKECACEDRVGAKESVNAMLINQIYEWKKTFENFYDKIKDISKMAEICITKENPNLLYCSTTLTPSSLQPNLHLYEIKISHFPKINIEQIQIILEQKNSKKFTKEKMKNF